jgi:hypothetical protein
MHFIADQVIFESLKNELNYFLVHLWKWNRINKHHMLFFTSIQKQTQSMHINQDI